MPGFRGQDETMLGIESARQHGSIILPYILLVTSRFSFCLVRWFLCVAFSVMLSYNLPRRLRSSASQVPDGTAEPTAPSREAYRKHGGPVTTTPISLERLTEEEVYECVNGVLNAATVKRRRFLEIVDLLVVIKDYNTQRYGRPSGVIRLPHVIRPNFRGCLIGDKANSKDARDANLDFMDFYDVRMLHGRPMAIKKLAAKYDGFLAHEALIRHLKKILGRNFAKKGKCITPVEAGKPLRPVVEELKCSTRMSMRKASSDLTFTISVGHVKMTADELAENLTVAVTRVLEKMNRGWDNVRALSIKSTMGPVYHVY
ncbi:hypothetical protein HPB50_001054 [Hyalomma asiaticum]|uniref:Uncharacterized protein n=1 Tax=Hyalomma asiaticum TaxID=266040 RepID=A0ACB7RLX9_HYAAI|nr:hypothetical protein HPB50_001054 [Hyalomma asiaticum]